MRRREFVLGSLVTTLLAACGGSAAGGGPDGGASPDGATGDGPNPEGGPPLPTTAPNILVLIVDEMRVPDGFPMNVPQSFAQAIPWMLQLWSKSACFTSHFTAASDCSPSRASIVTGLYAQQHCLFTTRGTGSGSPSLEPAFTTYGTMLRAVGYDTYWFGKWHLSDLPLSCPTSNPLDAYGFDGGTCPDPIGIEGQGQRKDGDIATQFTTWLAARSASDKPWCATVSFVDPHDIQWFWTGSDTITDTATVAGETGSQAAPPTFGYDDAYFAQFGGNPVANFENPFAPVAPKPAMLEQFANFTMGTWGPISYSQSDLVPPEYNGTTTKPFSYWYKLLEVYEYVHGLVDQAIGQVLTQLWSTSSPFASNTIIIFTSDHGEYAGAHGIHGKGGGAYEEALRVPLAVYDPTGYYVRTTGVRTGLTSSVDLTPLLLTLANKASTSLWQPPDAPYAYLSARFDITSLLISPAAAGRSFILYSTDELLSGIEPSVASHVVTYRTSTGKLSAYNHWESGTITIDTSDGQEFEYYDLVADPGEVNNTAASAATAATYKTILLGANADGTSGVIATEMHAALPAAMTSAQQAAIAAYTAYINGSVSARF